MRDLEELGFTLGGSEKAGSGQKSVESSGGPHRSSLRQMKAHHFAFSIQNSTVRGSPLVLQLGHSRHILNHTYSFPVKISSSVSLHITMAGFRGRTSVDKQLLKNVIRHTESMNKVHEESEMWRQYKEMQTRRKDTSPYRSGQMRSDRNVDTRVKTSGGVSPGSSYWTKKLYEAEEADPDRWGHGGFKELYPDAFSSSSNTEGSEDRSRSKRRKKKKKAKKKDLSKKRKHSGDSDSSLQREKRKMLKKRKRKKHEDDKKTKLTSKSNGTHSGKNERNDQQSSSIFIPAHAEKDKSVRHRPRHKQSRKAERDHSHVDADSSSKRRRGDGNAKIRDRKRHSDGR
ncbi:uncharacterized protein NKAPD1-like [Branchiostoma lanceolatum]|uniref:uncharacterized protein NKAPD1-like n=1 Tax=Branchiostoma lanceolatum TaxID=7740 RepID=UPI0034566977